MSVPAYPSYQGSGVEWLGPVPSHWSIDRIKASIASSRNGIWGGDPGESDEDIVCIRVADFDRTRFVASIGSPTMRRVTEKERSGRILQAGDLLLEKSGGGEKQPVGAVVQYCEDVPAVCSNFVARIELTPGMHSRFWTYVHAAAYSIRLTQGAINQTSGIQNLDSGRYFEERAPFPPLPEQAAIATFLDRETAKIDALVEEQQRLIELLKEKRQAVISHAVTKGLDPTVPMEDSGVEWLGEIPAHWRLLGLKRVTEAWCDGPFGSGLKSEHYVDNGVRVVRLQNIKETGFAAADAAYIDEQYFHFELSRHEVRPGDVLVAGLGDDRNLVGRACVAPLEIGVAMVKADCFRLRVDQASAHPAFIAYQLNASAAHDAGTLSTGTTRSRIPLSTMMNRCVAVPSLKEQLDITSYLSKTIPVLAALEEQVQTGLAILAERRAALVSAAVTGKIDVRSTVADRAEAA